MFWEILAGIRIRDGTVESGSQGIILGGDSGSYQSKLQCKETFGSMAILSSRLVWAERYLLPDTRRKLSEDVVSQPGDG